MTLVREEKTPGGEQRPQSCPQWVQASGQGCQDMIGGLGSLGFCPPPDGIAALLYSQEHVFIRDLQKVAHQPHILI